MTNHVHLIAIPDRDDSLAVLFRRLHGRYSSTCRRDPSDQLDEGLGLVASFQNRFRNRR
jgi:REP element-mobilizing transposase RayT